MDFKGKAKAFVRTYGFLASVLPYNQVRWEKLSIFLNFLIPKLPAPKEVDLATGILETIDMDSYRVEVQATMRIALADEDAEIEPVPTSGGGRLHHLGFKDPERIARAIAEEIPPRVAANKAYQNAIKNSDEQNARIEHDRALKGALVEGMSDHMELFKYFQDDPGFKKWLSNLMFTETYKSTASRLRPYADLERRLQASGDPVDGLSLSLLGTLARQDRLTFGDALALAEEKRLSETEAFMAIERLARPGTAGLHRYYIDRSVDPPRLLTTGEAHEQMVTHWSGTDRSEWLSDVEVAWADSGSKAMGQGAAS